MHRVIPYAAPLPEPGRAAMAGLRWPALSRGLAGLADPERDDTFDEWSLTPPHERAVATALEWNVSDGLVPTAAWAAADDGIASASAALAPEATERSAFALLTPAHWHVGAEQLRMEDPAALQLDEAASRALLAVVAPLFTSEGFAVHWGAPERWYLEHPMLATVPTASLQRVVGRNIDAWLGSGPALRLLRRLQNEVQMLLHEHPLNEARESRGRLPVNSVWISGTGPTQPLRDPRPQVDDRLVAPALVGDWPAWADAWAQLDAELAAQPWTVLTLCGERGAITWRREAAAPWWKAAMARLRGVDVAAALEGL
ncbi:MAG: hypothetical protein JNN18_07585 [Rubrivivax sp.]|jgi:hypothetical protein|nr:hypothetical protein [Rubrivivax sp.]